MKQPEEVRQLLADAGITFADVKRALGVESATDPYVTACEERYGSEGEIEFDDYTMLSDSCGGNYVLAWIWVSDSDAGIEDEDEDEDEEEEESA